MKKKHLLIVVQLFLLSLACPAQQLVSSRIACGPWLQAVGETEFTVVWATTAKSIAWVEVAPDDGTHFYGSPRQQYYESHHGRRPIGDLHTIRVSGLQKGTNYRYRIYQQALLSDEGNKRMIFGEAYGNDILKHPDYKVTTLDSGKTGCSFSMVNDIHGNDSLFRNLTKGVLKSGIDFMVFNGDMLTQIESPRQIMEGYLRSAGETFAPFLPVFAVRGNHEHRGSASYDYMKFFPTSTGKPYYTFRQGPAFFIALDCGEDKPDSDIRYYGLSLTDQLREEEALWLREVVASEEYKQAPLKIVILHMPPGIGRDWHGMKEISRLFMPILNEASVDLMLSGHWHRHVYIKEGERGNQFPILVNSNKHRLDVQIENGTIQLSAVDETGRMVKNYTLRK